MTHEERASLIKKLLFPGVVVAIVAGVWLYPKPGGEASENPAPQVVTQSPEDGLAIIHYHLPDDPASEQLADILNRVQKKYGKLVIISRVDSTRHPELAKAHGVTKPPHVIIISGREKAFEFQGLWSQAKVELKVDEILRGLKRVGKDWRPAVPGMTPAAGKK
jgi:hypothetical protein